MNRRADVAPEHPAGTVTLPRRVLGNPITGERIVIRTSGTETGGELLVFDLYLPEGGHVAAGHVHPQQEERFTVAQGRLKMRLGRATMVAGPGETVTIPAGVAHWFGNAWPGTTRVRVEVRPALRMEALFEAAEGLRVRRFLGIHVPSFAELARFTVRFQPEINAPAWRGVLVRRLIAARTRMSRLR